MARKERKRNYVRTYVVHAVGMYAYNSSHRQCACTAVLPPALPARLDRAASHCCARMRPSSTELPATAAIKRCCPPQLQEMLRLPLLQTLLAANALTFKTRKPFRLRLDYNWGPTRTDFGSRVAHLLTSLPSMYIPKAINHTARLDRAASHCGQARQSCRLLLLPRAYLDVAIARVLRFPVNSVRMAVGSNSPCNFGTLASANAILLTRKLPTYAIFSQLNKYTGVPSQFRSLLRPST